MAKRIVDLVKDLILDKKDIKKAIDMTAGTGKDSKFILENTQVENLTAFDIQKQAEEETRALIGEDKRFTFILASHEKIDKYIKDPVDLIIYNLGYLPGADKNITTKAETTLKSLEKALKLIKKDGRIILTIYPGHPAGRKESQSLESYLESLDNKTYSILKITYTNRPNNPPYILVIEKEK
ncbi:class I SAM-dependent methyltransferase [Anaerococcus sp. NML200574]|uniref:Class I SAM-dependent methyltransferase n=1 Tax=Anaerococcus kampingae TaxID=3115614 RepID=A0ABW9MH32_9FIRM|nr:class I SAM-dependent methyltransferase [Anaerococcus sp. NML200574]MCW6679544.1 class I SAM-dependent methyltransferase [Anaerococcus sp. NML200574]